MKTKSKLIVVVVASLVLASDAFPQNPVEQLKQMVEQLQATPNDNALREKIIKLAAEMKPPPAIPEDATRNFVRGNTFQKEAKSVADYDLAIAAYREALKLAPWWADAYFNLAVAFESAKKYDDAITTVKLYLISVPADSQEARDAKNHIYSLEAKKELASRPPPAPPKPAPIPDRLSGTWTEWSDDYSRPRPASTREIHWADLVITYKGNGSYQMQYIKKEGYFFSPERRHETWTFTLNGNNIQGTFAYDGIYDWGGGSRRSCDPFTGNATGRVYGNDKDIELKYSSLFLGASYSTIVHCQVEEGSMRLRRID